LAFLGSALLHSSPRRFDHPESGATLLLINDINMSMSNIKRNQNNHKTSLAIRAASNELSHARAMRIYAAAWLIQ
jgi:hypothetical protein